MFDTYLRSLVDRAGAVVRYLLSLGVDQYGLGARIGHVGSIPIVDKSVRKTLRAYMDQRAQRDGDK